MFFFLISFLLVVNAIFGILGEKQEKEKKARNLQAKKNKMKVTFFLTGFAFLAIKS